MAMEITHDNKLAVESQEAWLARKARPCSSGDIRRSGQINGRERKSFRIAE
jgi:hypothetical protein